MNTVTPLIARLADLVHERNYYVCSGNKKGRECEDCVRAAFEIASIFLEELLDARDASEKLHSEVN